ncbi:MAG: hypothetical protein KJ893_02165 [Candidatus Omnitrophica bacterium]|nr:hypothetical protein [Candidatus Omnitrophota bacterium]MBU4478427.1 hypothetical protein [Candidatus Omnitrophota bacterium]
MPYKNNSYLHPNQQPKKQKKPDKSQRAIANRNTDLIQAIAFENALAAGAQEKDIYRACAIFHEAKKKSIQAKISPIFFN